MESGTESQNLAVYLTAGALLFAAYVGVRVATEPTRVEPAIREAKITPDSIHEASLQCLGNHVLQLTLPRGDQHSLHVNDCDPDNIAP